MDSLLSNVWHPKSYKNIPFGDHSRSQVPKSYNFQIGGSGLLAFDFVAPDGFGVFFLVSLASLEFRVCLGVEFRV